MNTKRTWDLGDPEPEGVTEVNDFTAEDVDAESSNHPGWGKTNNGRGWKGYKDGGKTYMEWDELVRRYGPLTDATPAPVKHGVTTADITRDGTPGTLAKCTCGWSAFWSVRDGSAEQDGAEHMRRQTEGATS